MTANQVFGRSVLRKAPYRVIYADPPWPEQDNNKTYLISNPDRKYWGRDFETMSAQDIIDLPVRDLADQDESVLLLWSTFRHLPIALSAMQAWGFSYCREAFVWIKTKKDGNPIYSLAYDTGACAEICLLGKTGRRPPPARRMVPSVVHSVRERVAQKPQEVRDRIEAMYPDANKIELFARAKHKGWTVWGNEV